MVYSRMWLAALAAHWQSVWRRGGLACERRERWKTVISLLHRGGLRPSVDSPKAVARCDSHVFARDLLIPADQAEERMLCPEQLESGLFLQMSRRDQHPHSGGCRELVEPFLLARVSPVSV